MKRRKFIISSIISGSIIPISQLFASKKRKFKISLNPGSIGINYEINELLELAHKYRFEAISPNIKELELMNEDQSVLFSDKVKISLPFSVIPIVCSN